MPKLRSGLRRRPRTQISQTQLTKKMNRMPDKHRLRLNSENSIHSVLLLLETVQLAKIDNFIRAERGRVGYYNGRMLMER